MSGALSSSGLEEAVLKWNEWIPNIMVCSMPRVLLCFSVCVVTAFFRNMTVEYAQDLSTVTVAGLFKVLFRFVVSSVFVSLINYFARFATNIHRWTFSSLVYWGVIHLWCPQENQSYWTPVHMHPHETDLLHLVGV